MEDGDKKEDKKKLKKKASSLSASSKGRSKTTKKGGSKKGTEKIVIARNDDAEDGDSKKGKKTKKPKKKAAAEEKDPSSSEGEQEKEKGKENGAKSAEGGGEKAEAEIKKDTPTQTEAKPEKKGEPEGKEKAKGKQPPKSYVKLEYTGNKLSGEQVEMIKAAYQMCDADGDGLLTGVKEVGGLMRTVGSNPSQATVKALVGDRETVNFNEFCDLMAELHAKDDKDDGVGMIMDAFAHVFDKDRTGKIALTELKHVMTSMGELLDEQEEAGMLKEAEMFLDGNGNVDYAEFIKSMLV